MAKILIILIIVIIIFILITFTFVIKPCPTLSETLLSSLAYAFTQEEKYLPEYFATCRYECQKYPIITNLCSRFCVDKCRIPWFLECMNSEISEMGNCIEILNIFK